MNKDFDMRNIFHSNDEMELKDLFKILFFNKKIIYATTLLFFLFGLVFSFTRKKVYQGEFQIVIDVSSNQTQISPLQISGLTLLDQNSQQLETEIGILKSPLVLSEVFSFVNSSRQNNNSYSNLSFKKWLKKNLIIELENKTSILNLIYKDHDKDIILPVLNKISNKYQEYSKEDRNTEIIRTLNYLKSQKEIMSNKSKNSFIAFNKFSIENGLGSRDAFVDIDLLNKDKTKDMKGEESLNFNQRFDSQFQLLESYESKYMDLSSSMKPSSNYLKELKNKIDNLRNSLKQPNEILAKYNELKFIAQRDSLFYNEINMNLERIKLEQAKTPYTWELITTPTLNQFPVAPKKKIITLAFTLVGFILSSIFVIFREKIKGIIYSSNDLNGNFNIPFISELSINDNDEMIETFMVISKSYLKSTKEIGLICVGDIDDYIVLDFLKVINDKFNEVKITLIKSFEETDSINKFILISGVKVTSKNQLEKILTRLEVLQKTNLGLILFKDAQT